jgi:hypothetical protein
MIRKVQTTPVVKLLLSSRESARALSISERTLWTITNEGKIPVCRVRGANRYHIDDLLAYIEASKTETRKPRRAAATPDAVHDSVEAAAKQLSKGCRHDKPKR